MLFSAVPTRPRRLALVFSLVWLALALLTALSSSRTVKGLPFLHWPFALTVTWTLLSALACAVVVTESLRRGVRSWALWRDGRHFSAVLVLALLLVLMQWMCLIFAA